MFVMRFTERAYFNYTEDDVKNSPGGAHRVTFSNSHFDPAVAADQYNYYLDEWQYCEEIGFDGMMLNEHHSTPTSLGAAMNLETAILARITKKPKIVLMGNPLPIHDNPLRLAEELAEIDCISRGRLVSGFVRGGGTESWATNTNPVYNRERFEEAHDLVVKTWTTPGPFRWEGKHYHFRVVNPFERPIQKPHPPVWIPGLGSPETLVWAAERHYPYIYLETDPQGTQDMMSIYTETARENGYEPGPEHFGYLIRCLVADTDERAQEVGRTFLWTETHRQRGPIEFNDPPGYQSREALRIKQSRPTIGTGTIGRRMGYEELQEAHNIIVGSPETVIKKLRYIKESLDPGYMLIYGNEGDMPHEDVMRSVELLGTKVIPAVKED